MCVFFSIWAIKSYDILTLLKIERNVLVIQSCIGSRLPYNHSTEPLAKKKKTCTQKIQSKFIDNCVITKQKDNKSNDVSSELNFIFLCVKYDSHATKLLSTGSQLISSKLYDK